MNYAENGRFVNYVQANPSFSNMRLYRGVVDVAVKA